MPFFIRTCTLLSAFLALAPALANNIPLRLDSGQWQVLQYNAIPANRVTQLTNGLEIRVHASASPLIYVFDQPRTIRQISVSGNMGELPDIPPGVHQGDKGADDFPLRLGLVLSGDKTLNFAQRLIAARWVRTLFDLAPAQSGIDRIDFLNLANPGPLAWRKREHPDGGGLYTETIVSQISSNQPYYLDYTLASPEKVLALWISSDGDDTRSTYTLTINDISYH